MSLQDSIPSERVCYVQCNFCNTVLAALPLDHQKVQKQQTNCEDRGSSSSKSDKFSAFCSTEHDLQPRLPPIRPPEKRQRVPSAYNRFIKEEIQRIKASNPEITHREAFSTAAKNWAHFPHIHFGLKLDGTKQSNHGVSSEGSQKSPIGFY